MKAGRELDALIAEKVMGWKRVPGDDDQDSAWDTGDPEGYFPYEHNFRPSIDIAAAWQVVEKLPYLFTLTTNNPYHPTTPETEWFASFQAEYEAEGCSPPHAICLAALKAVEE